jgi:hypothetical protein
MRLRDLRETDSCLCSDISAYIFEPLPLTKIKLMNVTESTRSLLLSVKFYVVTANHLSLYHTVIGSNRLCLVGVLTSEMDSTSLPMWAKAFVVDST